MFKLNASVGRVAFVISESAVTQDIGLVCYVVRDIILTLGSHTDSHND